MVPIAVFAPPVATDRKPNTGLKRATKQAGGAAVLTRQIIGGIRCQHVALDGLTVDSAALVSHGLFGSKL